VTIAFVALMVSTAGDYTQPRKKLIRLYF